MIAVVVLVLAGLSGSIPFSWLLVWTLYRVDLRTVGSSNPGATNAMRVAGKTWGLVALALDIAKGILAVSWATILLGPEHPPWLPMASGLAAILGNIFCPFLRFKGGKAVATATGVFVALAPHALAAGALTFALLMAVTRIVSISSLGAAVVLPIALTLQWVQGWGGYPYPGVVALAYLAAILVIWRHRSNLARLLAGRESAWNDRLKPSADTQPNRDGENS